MDERTNDNTLSSDAKKRLFTEHLLTWFAAHDRPLPWKGERDPYLIWLSEIILQQTRVEQGRPYYERFRDRYPHVTDLAAAPEDEVMKMWEGLGYYSRARNLHATAQRIATEFGGQFPTTYDGIRDLKGVGDYTAAAIASFAYGLPHAVVDGNVYRVLARVFGIATPTDTTAGKRAFAQLAHELLPPHAAAIFNQAIMDFGATWCTPAAPKCTTCPMRTFCTARHTDRVGELPVKSKKQKRRDRYFHYLVVRRGAHTWVRRRGPGDVWQNLYEFPLIEAGSALERSELTARAGFQQLFPHPPDMVGQTAPVRQLLSHQRIFARFFEIRLPPDTDFNTEGYHAVSWTELERLAFPKIITTYLRSRSIPLELF